MCAVCVLTAVCPVYFYLATIRPARPLLRGPPRATPSNLGPTALPPLAAPFRQPGSESGPIPENIHKTDGPRGNATDGRLFTFRVGRCFPGESRAASGATGGHRGCRRGPLRPTGLGPTGLGPTACSVARVALLLGSPRAAVTGPAPVEGRGAEINTGFTFQYAELARGWAGLAGWAATAAGPRGPRGGVGVNTVAPFPL